MIMRLKRNLMALVLLLSSPLAIAVPVTVTFEATVINGPYAGLVGTGFFEYDEALLFTGDAVLGPDGSSFADEPGLLDLQFAFLGQTFTMLEDLEYPDFPLVEFIGFQPDFMEFLVVDMQPADIADPLVEAFFVGGPLTAAPPGAGVDFLAEVEVLYYPVPSASVPAPMPLALLAAGVLAMGAVRRRH